MISILTKMNNQIEVKVPNLGESVIGGTIVQIFVSKGDYIKEGDDLALLDTDKTSYPIKSYIDGQVLAVNYKVDDFVESDKTIFIVSQNSNLTAADKVAADNYKVADSPIGNAASGSNANKVTTDNNKSAAGSDIVSSGHAKDRGAKSTDSNNQDIYNGDNACPIQSRNGLTNHGQDSSDDAYSSNTMNKGSSGTMNKGSSNTAPLQERYAGSTANPLHPLAKTVTDGDENAAETPAKETRVKMSTLRKLIAHRLKESQNNAAILTTFNEVDMSSVATIRKNNKDSFEKKYKVKLGFMSFFIKATVCALQEYPIINASIENDEIVYKNYYHIGVAIGSKRGLLVPVIKDADKLSIDSIEKTIIDFANKANDGTIDIEDLKGGTFTISNGGVYGSMMSTPIINPPQSAILGMHSIIERPVVVGGCVVIKPMMYLALSYDHRIIDGKDAVLFLCSIKKNIDNPGNMIL